ncbi:MAG TPA: cupin domain-containing protein, partial [Casimicrobium sp.]|nr:cupin domain-containing protein [Casimicrobium sp.]
MNANTNPTTKTLLGGLTPREFMAKHWQKHWKHIEQAVPAFEELLSIDDMWTLACSEDVES